MVKSGTALCCLVLLVACEPASITLLGVGAGAGISHHMGGVAYRTFSQPLPKVRNATLTALQRMAIEVQSTRKTPAGELIRARAADRDIELELEGLTPNTTRIRAVARINVVLVDSATAVEVVAQIEKALSGLATEEAPTERGDIPQSLFLQNP